MSVGAVSSIGFSTEEMFDSLAQEKHGLRKLKYLQTAHSDLPVGEVQSNNQQLADSLQVDSHWPRATLFGLYAVKMAMSNLGISQKQFADSGFINATTVGGMDKTEEVFPEFIKGNDARLHELLNHECGKVTELISEKLGLKKFSTTINTACSSSANSIMFASRMIAQGRLELAIAGGTDALTRFTLNGFKSLMIVDSELCVPMDAARKGLNLGEGAGYLVLASEDFVEKNKITPIAEVVGFANTNDAYHQTATSPEGRGPYEAMKQALALAQLQTDKIDYINLHGTGTTNNDQSESTAVKRLFEDHLVSMSSTKSFTGHTLGASGGLEAVISVLSLKNQCVFPNLRFKNPIPETNITPVTHFRNQQVNYVMSNSFGFGGNCSTLIFKKA